MNAGGRVRIVTWFLIAVVCFVLSLSAAAQNIDELKRRAQQGDSSAQTSLGMKYQNGEGVQKDYAEAARWFRKAAEQGNASGQNNLGVMYLSGRGVAKNNAEAVHWFHKAADQGSSMGQYNLGVMYRNGRGVPRDDTEALRWYRKAADQGNKFGQDSLGWAYENGRGVPQDLSLALYWYNKAAEQGHEPSKQAIRRINVAGGAPSAPGTNAANFSVAKPQPEPQPEPGPQPQPQIIDRRLSINEIEKLLKDVSPVTIAKLVQQYGVNFESTTRIKERLRKLGADDKLLSALADAYGISLVLTATQRCRVSIYVDGKQVMEETMDPNSADKHERSFHARRRLVVVAGNPAGIDVTFNGQSMGPIGSSNTKRTITFTPEGVRQ
ncbi:MAG: RodZ domain-containing protein [Candidatus Korobacteraceae bacterium]|jgi:hypothetical protein